MNPTIEGRSMREHSISAGTHVGDAAKELVKLAKQYSDPVKATFNGIEMVARPDSSAAEVEQNWHNASKRRSEERRKSPEYKKAQAERTARARALQKQADDHMKTLNRLDTTDLGAVITWLEHLLAYANGGGSNIAWPRVIKHLERHGFVAGANAGKHFNENDRDNHGRWLVGNWMSCVKDTSGGGKMGGGIAMNALNNTFDGMAQDWRRKFGVTK